MDPEYLDLDAELLREPAGVEDGDDLDEDLSFGLDQHFEQNLDFKHTTPKFVSSLDQNDNPPANPNPTPNPTPNDNPPAGADGDEGQDGNDDDDEPEDLIAIILRSKGVTDPNKIKMEAEDGTIQEMSFNDLDYETQVELLTASEEVETPQLSEDEESFISYLRENNLTVEELLEKQRETILQEVSEQVGAIDFDEISDEDLFKLDLQTTYDSLSEEEVDLLMAKEQEHPELFAKKINKLRSDYKEAEENKRIAELNEIEEQKRQEYEEFSNGLFETAKGIDEIGGLTLSDKDRQDVLEAILKPDENGVSEFTKLFNDKDAFFKMAWFATKGKEAFEMLHSHYKTVIEDSRKEIKRTSAKPTTKVTFKADIKGLNKPTTTRRKNTVSDDAFVADNFV